jgi:RNA polymerase-binding transcription factor DksA
VDSTVRGLTISLQSVSDARSPAHSDGSHEAGRDDAALLSQVSSELDAVEAALERLESGSAGTCEICGVEIDPEQMRARPLASRCPAHPV